MVVPFCKKETKGLTLGDTSKRKIDRPNSALPLRLPNGEFVNEISQRCRGSAARLREFG
jgi:hypothetical protein